MAWRFRSRSIRSKLIFVFLTAFTPLAVLHFAAYSHHYLNRHQLILEHHAVLAETVAASIDHFVKASSISQLAVAQAVGRGYGDRYVVQYLNSIQELNKGIRSVAVVSDDGSYICSGNPDLSPEDNARYLAFSTADAKSSISVSDSFRDRQGHRLLAVCSSVATSKNSSIAIKSLIDSNVVMQCIPSNVSRSYGVVIIDQYGRVVYQSRLIRAMHLKPDLRGYAFFQRALHGKESAISGLRSASGPALCGYATAVPNVNWVVAVLEREDRVMLLPLREEFRWLVLSVMVTLGGLILMVSLGNRISIPINRLSRGAAALAVGDLRKRIDIKTGDELEFLADRFNTMGESLERHERELTNKTLALEGLFDVAKAVTSSLNVDEILKSLVKVTRKVMGGKACAIFLADTNGDLMTLESCNLSDSFLASLQGVECIIGKSIRKRTLTVCHDLKVDGGNELSGLCSEEGLASVISAPIVAGKNALGALTIWTSRKTQFSSLQIDVLRLIAGYASTVIKNAVLYVEEHTTAQALQHSLIGDIPNEMNGLHFGCKYIPARDESRVGGDFYDVMELPDGNIGVVIADVSGKGLEAAKHTAMCKHMLRGFAFQYPESPSKVMASLNEALCHYAENRFFLTAFYAVVNTRDWSMTYANAGHPPPMVMSHGGKMLTLLYKTGAPLAFDEGIIYSQRQILLGEGTSVFLYTDGVIEARDDVGMLDLEGLQEILLDYAHYRPQQLADCVCEKVRDYSTIGQRDDVAVVVLLRNSEDPGVCAPVGGGDGSRQANSFC